MTAVRTFEVLCGWIESATNQDHLDVIIDYISRVFLTRYPAFENVIHGHLVESMMQKINAKDLNPETHDVFTQTTD
jgi:hypothetical protein